MANYEWSRGSRAHAYDPTEVHGFIEQVRRRGPLSTEAVLQAARAKNSPVHDYYLWDNEAAAEKYRLMQTSQIMTSLRTMNGSRVYVVARRKQNGTSAPTLWEPFSSAQHRQSFRREQIGNFYKDLDRLVEKYGYLSELQGQLKLLASIRPVTRKAAG